MNALAHITPRLAVLASVRYVDTRERFDDNFNNGVLLIESSTSSQGAGPRPGSGSA